MLKSNRDYILGKTYLGRFLLSSKYFPITYLGNFQWETADGKRLNHTALSEVRSKEPVHEVRQVEYRQ